MKRKLYIFLVAITTMISVGMSQTYMTPPYSDDFESGTLGAEWTVQSPGATNVINTALGSPYEGSRHLLLDDGTEGGTNTKSATLHLDLSGATDYTLFFYVKEFDDEEHTEDGVFMYDIATSSYVKIFDFDPVAMTSFSWYYAELDLDELAATAGLTLSDSTRIRFQTRDDRDYGAGGGNEDGWAYDSIAVYVTPPFEAGSIAGTDTICNSDIASSTVTITSTQDARYGSGTITYDWESTTDFITWSSIGSSGSNPDTSFAAPSVTTFYRRCASTSGGDGPLCTSPIAVFVSSALNVNINGLDPTYCNNEPNVTIYGTPTIGTFSGTGITDNGDGSAVFSPSTGPTGTRTIYYTYTDSYGCTEYDSVITDILTAPVASFSGLGASYSITDTAGYTLSGSPSAGGTGYFTGFGMVADTFFPAYVGEPKLVNIKYVFTATNGCSDTASQSTNIVGGGSGSISGLASSYCEDDAPVTIIGSPKDPGNDLNGYFYIYTFSNYYGQLDGSPDSNPNYPDTAYFRPSLVGPGTYYIYYYHNTTGWINQAVTVHPLPNLSIGGLSSQYCLEDPSTTLTGYDNGVAVSGTFSGPGITGNTFDPQAAGVGTHSITFDYTNPSTGCSNSTSMNVTVYAMPTPSFSGNDGDYCTSDPVDTLTGSPTGGSFAGVGITNLGSGQASFNPNMSPGTYDISYSYTDGNSCTVIDTQQAVVHAVPSVNYVGLTQTVVCGDAAPINLIGTPSNDAVPGDTGFFRGDSLVEGVIDHGDGTATLRPDLAVKDSQFVITYVYTDNFGCTDSASQQLTYSELPIVQLLGLDSIYCEFNDTSSGSLIGTVINEVGGQSWFDGPGTFKKTFYTGTFNPSSAGVGYHPVDFRYTNDYGCTAIDTQWTRVINIPTVGFTLSGYCNNDTVYFTDTSFADPLDSIISWDWDYNNGLFDTVQNGKTWYNRPGQYNFKLTVGTKEACTSSVTITDTIGQPADVDFYWDNICFGDTITFVDSSTFDDIDSIETWSWEFGDGNVSSIQNPIHLYTSQSSYDVQLTLTTRKNCIDSLTKTIHIRPVVDSFPYFQDFETGNGGWFPGGTIADTTGFSWIWGVSAGNFIDSASGNRSYFTGLGDYPLKEISYVDGACFDFSSLTKPMIVFDRKTEFNTGFDGSNLQYSVDNGITWNNLGSVNSGISWYDNNAISAEPGDRLIGWSRDTYFNWEEARHDLDGVAGLPNVKLRFTFSSLENSQNPGNGFAFDNIWIGERSRKVLYEHFTSYESTTSETTDGHLNGLVASRPKDVVDIQYHIDEPGSDIFHTHNPADAGTRSLFYGLFQEGMGALDGSSFGIGTNSTDALDTLDIELRRLVDAQFDISIAADVNGGESSINVEPTITSIEDLDSTEVVVHIVVVERDISGVTGTYGQTEFKSVMKKMLPNATGTAYYKPWTAGETVSFREGWGLENVYDQNQLRVVVFVQNNVTKEIYQTAVLDSFAVSTGTENELAVGNKIAVFPNPTNGEVNMLFSKPLNGNATMILFNSNGQKVRSRQIFEGTNLVHEDLSGESDGMYFIQVLDENNIPVSKSKFVISR